MDHQETLYLWERCQAAKKLVWDQEIEKGMETDRFSIIEDLAQETAREIWNTWAQPLLDEKKKLQQKNMWRVENIDWEGRAAVKFYDLVFISDKKQKHAKQLLLFEGERINFSGFLFPGRTCFVRVEYQGYITDFSDTHFLGDMTLFHENRFLTSVTNYSKASFRNSVSFDKTEFCGVLISFKEVCFHNSSFTNVKFEGSLLLFEKAQFQGQVFSISATQFLVKKVRFQRSFFSVEITNFKDNHFVGEKIYFDFSIFEKSTNFDHSNFNGEVSFQAISSDKSFSLADTYFDKIPNFIEASFNEPPRLDNIIIDEVGKYFGVVNEDVPAMYRALKRMAAEGHDHLNEMNFFAGEIRSSRNTKDIAPKWLLQMLLLRQKDIRWKLWFIKKISFFNVDDRKLKQQKYNSVHITKSIQSVLTKYEKVKPWPSGTRYILGWFYEILSDFGRSIKKPLCIFGGVVIIFAFLFFGLRDSDTRFSVSCNNSIVRTNALASATIISLRKALPLANLDRITMEQSYKCLYGVQKLLDKKEATYIPFMVTVLGVLETILSTVLIFLFGLAIRNNFKIK